MPAGTQKGGSSGPILLLCRGILASFSISLFAAVVSDLKHLKFAAVIFRFEALEGLVHLPSIHLFLTGW